MFYIHPPAVRVTFNERVDKLRDASTTKRTTKVTVFFLFYFYSTAWTVPLSSDWMTEWTLHWGSNFFDVAVVKTLCEFPSQRHVAANTLSLIMPSRTALHQRELASPWRKMRYGIVQSFAACGISGDANPSNADRRLTHSVNMAASTMQIQFLDHLIMGAPAEVDACAGYFSFKEAGLL
jgi:RadC-like JAB domain